MNDIEKSRWIAEALELHESSLLRYARWIFRTWKVPGKSCRKPSSGYARKTLRVSMDISRNGCSRFAGTWPSMRERRRLE